MKRIVSVSPRSTSTLMGVAMVSLLGGLLLLGAALGAVPPTTPSSLSGPTHSGDVVAVPSLTGASPRSPMLPQLSVTGASPPVGEFGTGVGTIATSSLSYGSAFDPANGYTYVDSIEADQVLVYNGSSFVGNVSVGSEPNGVAYDPVTHDMWVTNLASGNVTWISGTTVVLNFNVTSPGEPTYLAYDPDIDCMVISLYAAEGIDVFCQSGESAFVPLAGAAPQGVVYDPLTKQIFVAEFGLDEVVILDGTSVLMSKVGTVPVGSEPYQLAFDSANGAVFVTNIGSGNVTEISGGMPLASFNVGSEPTGIVFDPVSQNLYVASFGSGTVEVLNPDSYSDLATFSGYTYGETITYDPYNGLMTLVSVGYGIGLFSVVLGISPAWTSLGSTGVSFVDVGQSFSAEANLYARGSEKNSPSLAVTPMGGLDCAAVPSGPAGNGIIAGTCTAMAPGTYTIWVNDSDTGGGSVWSFTTITVDPALSVSIGTTSTSVLDLGQSLQLDAVASGGSGGIGYAWLNLPSGCASVNAATLTCTPDALGTFSVSVSVSDSNGASAESNALGFTVVKSLSNVSLAANRLALDVGQSLSLGASVSGGVGSIGYAWAGLPTGCVSASSAAISCEPTTSGTFSISVNASDSNGVVSVSNTVSVVVSPRLLVSSLVSNVSSLYLGRSVSLSVTTVGGSGGLSYTWSGLPSGCTASNGDALRCTPLTNGTFVVSVAVNDSNGGVAFATVGFQVVSPPPAAGQPVSSLNQPLDNLQLLVELTLLVVFVAVVVGLLGMMRRPSNPKAPASPPPASPTPAPSFPAGPTATTYPASEAFPPGTPPLPPPPAPSYPPSLPPK